MSEHGAVTEPGTLRLERVLPGPIERLWRYLTDPEKRRTWLARGEMELREGGPVELVFRHAELSDRPDPVPAKYASIGEESRLRGRVLTCEPPRLLRYSWREDTAAESEVTFELTPAADRVHLVLTHRRLHSRDEMVSVGAGWHTHLDILIARLEGAEPPRFWATHAQLETEYDRLIPVG